MPGRLQIAATGGSAASTGTLPKRGNTPIARPGRITVWAPEVRTYVTGGYTKPPQVVGERSSNGAWEPIPRQRRRPLSSWKGPQEIRVECEVRFDGWDTQTSVEPLLERLRGLQNRLPGDDAEDRPPYLLLVGYAPGHYATVRWQIDDLKIEEIEHLQQGLGECAQAVATITLVEFLSADVKLSVERRTKAGKEAWRKGDTLAKFAKRELGANTTASRRALRKANPAIKAWSKVKPGRIIRIPASTTVSS